MNPRSVASSQTGKRGQDVRHASSTSAYGRGLGPIHSSRSMIRVSTVSSEFEAGERGTESNIGALFARMRQREGRKEGAALDAPPSARYLALRPAANVTVCL